MEITLNIYYYERVVLMDVLNYSLLGTMTFSVIHSCINKGLTYELNRNLLEYKSLFTIWSCSYRKQ